MNVSVQEATHRGTWLLAAHLTSLDPCAVSVRQRLEAQVGRELARRLVRALTARRSLRRVL